MPAGNFTDYSAAVKYRKEIEDIYPDAFVIAVKRQQNITFAAGTGTEKKK